jgi:polyhydroxybutyrate depolymerase
MISRCMLLILLCFVTGCDDSTLWTGSVTNEGQYYLEIEHDGLTRGYQLHIPKGYSGQNKVPVYFDLHPLFADSYIVEKIASFRTYSDANGFILVQPNGLGFSWNAGPKCCKISSNDDTDDVGFIRAIRDDLMARGLNIDTSKVFLDGMSNGGYLSNRIACEDTRLVGGIAVVVGSIGFDSVSECQPSKPVPVLMISGGDDKIDQRNESFNRWVTLNSCSASSTETIGVFSCTTYTDCEGGVETSHCIGEGVGHCWPGTESGFYGCNQDLNASQHIIDFYSRID